MSNHTDTDALTHEAIQAAMHRGRVLRAKAFHAWLTARPAPRAPETAPTLTNGLCTVSRS